jgi:hypothetical protein
MNIHERLRRREEKKPLKKPREDESDEEFGALYFAQLATDIFGRARDSLDYEPIKLENQLKDLAVAYARQCSRRSASRPTTPRPTERVERALPNDVATHVQ